MTAEQAHAIRGYLALCREAGIGTMTARYLWDGLKAEVLPALAADLDIRALADLTAVPAQRKLPGTRPKPSGGSDSDR